MCWSQSIRYVNGVGDRRKNTSAGSCQEPATCLVRVVLKDAVHDFWWGLVQEEKKEEQVDMRRRLYFVHQGRLRQTPEVGDMPERSVSSMEPSA